jgi:hypothetical protein
MNSITKAIIIICLFNQQLLAKTPKTKAVTGSSYNIRELALPSEVDNISKQAGSIYYSPSVKGKVLIPVHFWGAITKSGLHFVPLDTNLINGISLAGGPKNNADLDNVRITSSREGKRKAFEFDLNEGGGLELEDFKLRPGDTVFIEKDTFIQDRAYYTSLAAVIATVLSSILLFREVKK